jgi:hypothetical protein
MVLRAVLVSSLLIGSVGCRDHSVKVRELTQKDLDSDPELAREVEAAKRQLGHTGEPRREYSYAKPSAGSAGDERGLDRDIAMAQPALDQASGDHPSPSADVMTAGAVPGEQLTRFVPAKLAGFAVSNRLDYPWSAAGAYALDGGYANLDIQNTFIRGSHDRSLEQLNDGPGMCPKREKLLGHLACLKVRKEDGETSIRWYLPDRLSVRIAAPTEALARKLAAELPIEALAKLSAAS